MTIVEVFAEALQESRQPVGRTGATQKLGKRARVELRGRILEQRLGHLLLTTGEIVIQRGTTKPRRRRHQTERRTSVAVLLEDAAQLHEQGATFSRVGRRFTHAGMLTVSCTARG